MNSRKSKVLIMLSRYEINGVCAVAKNLIDNFDRNRFEVVLLIEKIAERHFPVDRNIKIIDLDVNPQKRILRKIKNVWSILRSIALVCKEEKPDVVLTFGFSPNCYAILALRLLNKIDTKIIITEHCEAFLVRFKRTTLKERVWAAGYRIMIYFLYRSADCIVAVSENIARLIRKRLFYIRKDRVRVIYNPIDILNIENLSKESVDDLVFQKDVYHIAIMSRLSQEKGIEYLLEAVRDLKDKIQLRVLIMGEGEEKDRLKSLSLKYGIEKNVQFLGWQKNPFKYLAKCDIFALPSMSEGFPNAILEAMVCGVCVVASRCTPALEEIVDDREDGILVAPKNGEELSQAIYILLTDNELRKKIRYNAFKKVKRFDISKIIKEYEEILVK
ncbi:MAG: glycosyltransferase [Candidatus Omnitrophota bacterium]